VSEISSSGDVLAVGNPGDCELDRSDTYIMIVPA
jgi:hypothetical protein